MPAGRLYLAVVVGLAIAAAPAARAEQPSFGDLLARAEAQAAAGHRWTPPGDNMTETVAGMLNIISTATPQQLATLSALLESNTVHPGQARAPETSLRSSPTKTAMMMDKAASQADGISPQGASLAAPPSPNSATPRVVSPVAPSPGQRATGQPALGQPALGQPALGQPALGPPTLGQRAAELLARGHAAESEGDVSGARRIYATAVAQGSAAAARDLGRLYDPAYLKHTALGGIDADPALARHWYERAVAMGDADAGPLLQALAAR